MRWRSAALAVAVLLALPACSHATTKTLTLRYGPVTMGNFNVKFPKAAVPSPGVDGYVVAIHADLTDARGRRVTIREVMLHHTVFFQDTPSVGLNGCGAHDIEAFYGTGEEDQTLRLPAGYGYLTRRSSHWRMHAMLMSHSTRSQRVYVRYRVTVVTGRPLQRVRPFWVRASGCKVTYPIWGGSEGGPTDLRSFRWKVPYDGRIVAVGGHLHGGARDMWLEQPRCKGRRLLDTSPRYGMPDSLYYRARPMLHEPGPVDTRYFLSRTGIAVHKGETIELHSVYDNTQPHLRVMSIMHVYIAPGRVPSTRCAPLPADRQELTHTKRVRTEPPQVTVPLNSYDDHGGTREILTPPWPVKRVASNSIVHLKDFAFSPPHVEIRAGQRLRWSFDDTTPHNLTFANGPRMVPGPTEANGRRYTSKFTVPGHYELFCYLHPMTMHEVVEVLPR